MPSIAAVAAIVVETFVALAVAAADPLASFSNIKRSLAAVDARLAAGQARAFGKDQDFKKMNDEETKRTLFPSNYPRSAARPRPGILPQLQEWKR